MGELIDGKKYLNTLCIGGKMHMKLSTLIQVETHHVKNMNCLLERERNYEHNRTKLGDEVILIRVPVPNGPKPVTEEEKRDEQWISWLVLDHDHQRKGCRLRD